MEDRLEAITIRVYSYSGGGYLYDVYKDDVVDEDLVESGEGGGLCTTTMMNALGMALGMAEDVIRKELGDECPGCGDDMNEKGCAPSLYQPMNVCIPCLGLEKDKGDFIGAR